MPEAVRVEKPVSLDLLDKPKPATSTMSDAPVIETRPDSTPKPDAATEEVTTTEESATSETPESTSANDKPKVAKGVQKRLDELTRQREDERRARLRSEELLQKALDALNNAGKPKSEATDEDAEPTEPDVSKYTEQDKYNSDYRAYLRNLARWEGRQVVKAERQREQEETKKRETQQSRAKAIESYQSNVSKAREKYPDYDQVAGREDLPITQVMADAIVQHEMGPDIAYHLGQNPQEAVRISRLSPHGQLMEAPKAPVSKAPAPIKPLTSGGGTSKSSDEPTMEEYAAKRKAQLGARR
jgi:hypothetical protein